MEGKKSACVATWFSGFFGLGAVLHLTRLLLRFPLTVGTFHVPLALSAVLVGVFGGLSLGLLFLACKKSCG